MWIPIDCSIYDRGVNDQDCRYNRITRIQMQTLRDIFQRNYPQFLVSWLPDRTFRVVLPETSYQKLCAKYKQVFPRKVHVFDISAVMAAFVVDDGELSELNQHAIDQIIKLLGAPQVI